MRPWQIIVASAAAATITDGVAFLPDALRENLGGAWGLFLARWPAIAVVWLGVYGIAAALLGIAGTVGEVSTEQDWFGRHVVQLAGTQYFTAALALAGFGWAPVGAEFFSPLPTVLGASPALVACGAAVIAGVFALLCLGTVSLFSQQPIPLEPLYTPEQQMLDEILVLLRARSVTRTIPDTQVALLSDLIERSQRLILGVFRDLAADVTRLRGSVDQIKAAMASGEPGEPIGAGSGAAAVAAAVGDLRAAAAAFDASVARLDQVAALLSSSETLVLAQPSPPPAESRARLSTELQELLRDMNPAVNPPAGRSRV